MLLPNQLDAASTFKSLVINKRDSACNSFKNEDHVDFTNKTVCMDPVYNVLWSYNPVNHELCCYNIVASEVNAKNILLTADQTILTNVLTITKFDAVLKETVEWNSFHLSSILSPELALPVSSSCHITRLQAAIHLLCCLDTLTAAHDLQLNSVKEEVEDRQLVTEKQYSREDFQTVNRFDSHGGGWGYSGHSIEAIRFMADTDILLGKFGVFCLSFTVSISFKRWIWAFWWSWGVYRKDEIVRYWSRWGRARR